MKHNGRMLSTVTSSRSQTTLIPFLLRTHLQTGQDGYVQRQAPNSTFRSGSASRLSLRRTINAATTASAARRTETEMPTAAFRLSVPLEDTSVSEFRAFGVSRIPAATSPADKGVTSGALLGSSLGVSSAARLGCRLGRRLGVSLGAELGTVLGESLCTTTWTLLKPTLGKSLGRLLSKALAAKMELGDVVGALSLGDWLGQRNIRTIDDSGICVNLPRQESVCQSQTVASMSTGLCRTYNCLVS
jgi:hypothetical protein